MAKPKSAMPISISSSALKALDRLSASTDKVISVQSGIPKELLNAGKALDDLAQDVWLTVVREASRYEVRARFTTWIFTLAHNRMVDHCRGRKTHASLEAENEDGQTLAETLPAPSGFGPLRRIESREQARQLLAALDALPLVQREAFVLQAEAGMSVAEIAQATGVGLETAKSRLRYARSALREQLEGMA